MNLEDFRLCPEFWLHGEAIDVLERRCVGLRREIERLRIADKPHLQIRIKMREERLGALQDAIEVLSSDRTVRARRGRMGVVR